MRGTGGSTATRSTLRHCEIHCSTSEAASIITRPGPHPFPAATTWHFTAHHQFKAVYASQHRSVYLMVQRLHPHPYLTIFNGPDTSMTTAVRDGSSVPLQALFLLTARSFTNKPPGSRESLLEQRSDPRARVRLAYLRVYGRPPSAPELDRSLEYLRRYEQPWPPRGRGRSPGCRVVVKPGPRLLASNEFIYVD